MNVLHSIFPYVLCCNLTLAKSVCVGSLINSIESELNYRGWITKCVMYPSGPILCFKVNWKHPSFAAQMRWGVMSLRDDENSFSGLAIVCALVELQWTKHVTFQGDQHHHRTQSLHAGKVKKKERKRSVI